jgi:Soluble lytic murein transglycosylase and related regulatory proteins (some contain LysM/invasin domains)
MPATAKDIADQLGEKYDATDAQQNIRFGKYYLEKLLNRYEGNIELALAAYNWGMGNLEKSIDKHAAKVIGEDGSIDIFALPNLPKETKNYS